MTINHIWLQNATIKQNREKEKLKVTHDKQTDHLSEDIKKVTLINGGVKKVVVPYIPLLLSLQLVNVYKIEEEECKLSAKVEFFA